MVCAFDFGFFYSGGLADSPANGFFFVVAFFTALPAPAPVLCFVPFMNLALYSHSTRYGRVVFLSPIPSACKSPKSTTVRQLIAHSSPVSPYLVPEHMATIYIHSTLVDPRRFSDSFSYIFVVLRHSSPACSVKNGSVFSALPDPRPPVLFIP